MAVTFTSVLYFLAYNVLMCFQYRIYNASIFLFQKYGQRSFTSKLNCFLKYLILIRLIKFEFSAPYLIT